MFVVVGDTVQARKLSRWQKLKWHVLVTVQRRAGKEYVLLCGSLRKVVDNGIHSDAISCNLLICIVSKLVRAIRYGIESECDLQRRSYIIWLLGTIQNDTAEVWSLGKDGQRAERVMVFSSAVHECGTPGSHST